jgi:lipoate-protein ligase A
MKDLEILENLDLNKILDELRIRDKKITRLDKVDQNFEERVQEIQQAHDDKLEELRRLL